MHVSFGEKRTKQVKYIVLHSIGGPTCTTDNKVKHTPAGKDAKFWVDWFAVQPKVSIHYVIDKKGATAKGLSEDEVAMHAYKRNSDSIGIELVNQGNGTDQYPKAQIDAVVKLLKELKSRYAAAEIVTHDQIEAMTLAHWCLKQICWQSR